VQDALSSLPCQAADVGVHIWDEVIYGARAKQRLGNPLFFTCDTRACCTTLCANGLDKFLQCTTSVAAEKVLKLPVHSSQVMAFYFTASVFHLTQCVQTCHQVKEMQLALCMGLHPRLGEHSPLHDIGNDLLLILAQSVNFIHEGSGWQRIRDAAKQETTHTIATPGPTFRMHWEMALATLFRVGLGGS